MTRLGTFSRKLFSAATLSALVAGCDGGGGGGGGGGGNGPDATPRPAQRRVLTITDAAGETVFNNPILDPRVIVRRGGDFVLFVPVGGDIFGTRETVVVRVTDGGEVKWARLFRMPALAFVTDAVDDGEGVSFISGGDAVVYVVRLDDDGAVRSQHVFDVPGANPASALTPLNLAPLDGGGLLLGLGVGAARLSADGAVQWANDAGIQGVQRLAVLPGGDFAFVGGLDVHLSRLSPAGEERFIGAGGIKGNFYHAGLVPTDDGGLFVVSGLDASDVHVSTVTTRVSADGTTGTLAGVRMSLDDNTDHETPLQFGAGARLQSGANGRVWASVMASSGGIGAMLRGPIVLAFDGGEPADAVMAALAFTPVENEIVGFQREATGQDVLVRVPRPQEGGCAVEPYNLGSSPLSEAIWALQDGAAVSPIEVTPTDAAIEVEDVAAALSGDQCQ